MTVTLSATLAANEDIERRRRAGERVLHLAFGEAGLPVHPALRDKLVAASERNGYGPVAGAAELRERGGGLLDTDGGSPPTPSWSSADRAASRCCTACCWRSAATSSCPCRAGSATPRRPTWSGSRPILVPAPRGEGGVPDPDLVTAAVQRARAQGRTVRSLLVTLPDNPTGTPGDAARPSGGWWRSPASSTSTIISDEIYRDLRARPGHAVHLARPTWLPSARSITTGLSKSLALGGWRIGVARLPDDAADLRAGLLAVASEIWSAPAAPVQEAAAYAFTEPPELTERIAREPAAARHGGARRARAGSSRSAPDVAAPQGGFYLYPDLSHLRLGGSAELTEILLDEHGIGVLPGHAFGDDPARRAGARGGEPAVRRHGGAAHGRAEQRGPAPAALDRGRARPPVDRD